jgi:hypothetical protein
MFVVASPERLASSIGDIVHAWLMRDLTELDAQAVWLREEASDIPIAAFASKHGFVATQRFTFDGVEIVVRELLRGAAHEAGPP